jgi:hypothetical protein
VDSIQEEPARQRWFLPMAVMPLAPAHVKLGLRDTYPFGLKRYL